MLLLLVGLGTVLLFFLLLVETATVSLLLVETATV